jgi:hypothetical protein
MAEDRRHDCPETIAAPPPELFEGNWTGGVRLLPPDEVPELAADVTGEVAVGAVVDPLPVDVVRRPVVPDT